MKKVSIITTVYNVEEYLEKCLKSLISQTLKDIEIIVVNDGSPDNSQKIIDKYAKKYHNIIKAYTIENRGLGGARNYGLEKSSGKYIMFVDSDDYIDATMAEELYNAAETEKSDISICGYKIINEDTGKVIDISSAFSPIEYTNPIYSILFGKTAVWNKLYRKSLLIDNNINFRSRIWYEDVDFSIKATFCANNFSYVDKPFYNYLIRNGSIMNNSNIERCLELCQSFDEVIKYCKNNKLYKKYYAEIEFCCIYHMYICGITRVINTNNKMRNKKRIINEYKKYIIKEFPDFKKNRYLSKLDKNKKTIYKLINLHQYRGISLLFKIKERTK